MKSAKQFLCILLSAVMLFGALPLISLASGEEETPGEISSSAAPEGYFTVHVHAGTATVQSGVYFDDAAKEGTVLSVSLDESAFPGAQFDCWKATDGTKIPKKTFRLLVTENVWIYPTFKDLKGDFGPWQLIVDGDCEEGKVYMRTDPASGLAEYKKEYDGWGGHDFSNYVYKDENTCAAVCVKCGKEEEQEHYWAEETVITEATHEHSGLVKSTCYNCGAVIERVIPMTGEHVWSAEGTHGNWEIITEAKDGQPGVRRRHCLYCEAYEDYWYIRAEWEKLYYGNKIWYDSSESVSLWGTDDELHYNFINEEGYETFVYAVRPDYRDNYQSYAFMWIDHADALGRKPLYLAKSKGYDERGYYGYYGFDWAIVGYLDSAEAFISEIDHITCGSDKYSSGFFDLAVKYENFYNESMIPANEDPSFILHHPEWTYESENGEYRLVKDGYTGLQYIPYKYNDARYFMHVDPSTNVCLSFWEPNASSHHAYIRSLQALVTPVEYEALLAGFTADAPVFPDIVYPEVTDAGEGHTHEYDYAQKPLPVDEERHVVFCGVCGEPAYSTHSYSRTIDFDPDDPRSSVKWDECSCGYFKDMAPNVMSTADIAAEIKNVFQRISAINSFTVNVLYTPQPKNFQLRVNAYYYEDGPYAAPDAADDHFENRFRWYGSTAIWNYGYEITDWSSFGIVRTMSTPAGYRNYSGGDTFFVEPIYEEAENYEFSRWEIYDWASGEWVFFSDERSPRFNTVEWDYSDPNATVFTSDSRVNDLTLLRCVRTYAPAPPAAPASVTVVGGKCYADGAYGGYSSMAESGEFAPGTMVYFENDRSLTPKGQRFEGWRIEKDGEVIEECSYGYGFTLESGEYIYTAVYVNERYYIQFEPQNGVIYLVYSSEEDGKGDPEKGKDPEEEEFWGGEYEAGTLLILRTEGEEGFPYFYGWYLHVWGKEEGGSQEEELLSTDTTFTYTVEGELNGTIYARWGETEEPPIDYHDLTAVNGFVSLAGARFGILVSDIRVSDDQYLRIVTDPVNRLDISVWRLTGETEEQEPFETEIAPYNASGEADLWIDMSLPLLLILTGEGTTHLHAPSYNEAVEPSCTEYGCVAYWYCEGCQQYFEDEECTKPISEDERFLDPLGHDFSEWVYDSESEHVRFCTRCEEEQRASHAPSDWIDCGAEGHCMHCPVCEADYVHLLHRFTAEVTVRPTASSKGEMRYTCALCSYSYTEELDEISGELDYVYVGDPLDRVENGHPVLLVPEMIAAYDEYGETEVDKDALQVFIVSGSDRVGIAYDETCGAFPLPGEVGVYSVEIFAKGANGAFECVLSLEYEITAYEGVEGDLDRDGSFDISDISVLLNALSFGRDLPGADVNGDGTVDIQDVSALLDMLSGAARP